MCNTSRVRSGYAGSARDAIALAELDAAFDRVLCELRAKSIALGCMHPLSFAILENGDARCEKCGLTLVVRA